DIDAGSANYAQTVQTLNVSPAPHGLTGVAVDAGGTKVYIAAPDSRMFDGTNRHEPGKIIVASVDRHNPDKPLKETAVLAAANEPYGVTAGFMPGQVLFVNRQTDGQGFGSFDGTTPRF